MYVISVGSHSGGGMVFASWPSLSLFRSSVNVPPSVPPLVLADLSTFSMNSRPIKAIQQYQVYTKNCCIQMMRVCVPCLRMPYEYLY